MTNPAYAMARLNEKTVRFYLGSGASGGHTPQDVAASIAFTKAGLGRELLQALFWPAGAQLSTVDLDQLLVAAQFGEWRERMDVLVLAQIKKQYATTTHAKREANAAIAAAQAHMWPAIDDTYRLMRRAVLMEMYKPRNCPDCSGSGKRVVEKVEKDCERCNGAGLTKQGPVWRAELMDMTHQSFNARWVAPYEWLLGHCRTQMREAYDEMSRALA
ncbi:hypothetical protein [Dyella japonica]|uniref:Antitermination protein n=1 Tax=Dyella japonica DSM 16301 TaxID=1440762 RepID=A0A0G9H6H5_9GAMM|nr:hypothetical protein [Dyella japonica]KLD65440.1 hypothetical protein Y882_02670 [Dyella japonica DSM 16301]